MAITGSFNTSVGTVAAPAPAPSPTPMTLSATLGPRPIAYSTAPLSSGLTRQSAGAAAANTYMATKQQTVQQAIGTGGISGGAVAMTSAPKPAGYLGMAKIPGSTAQPTPAPQPEIVYDQTGQGWSYDSYGQPYPVDSAGNPVQIQPSGYQSGGQSSGGQPAYYEDQGQSTEPSRYMVPVGTSIARDAAKQESVGFFRRIWNWMTGKKSQFGAEMNLPEVAASLVERARQGDQNAMALIATCSANAKKGNERARIACLHISRYIKNNPQIETHKVLPIAKQAHVNAQSMKMADGEILTDNRVRSMASSFGSEFERRAFIDGFNNHQNGRIYPADVAARNLGRTVGYARGIQALRMPGAHVRDFSPVVGWELTGKLK